MHTLHRIHRHQQRFRSGSETQQSQWLPVLEGPSGSGSGAAMASPRAGEQFLLRFRAVPAFPLPPHSVWLQFLRLFDRLLPTSLGWNFGPSAGVQFPYWSRRLRHGDLAGNLRPLGVVGRGAESQHGRRERCVSKRTSPVVAGVRDELAAPHLLPGGHGYSPLSSSDSFISNCPILR